MMHRRIGGAVAAFGLVALLAGPGAAQTIDAGPFELDFTGRVQTQFNTTSVDEDRVGESIAWSTFETRRVRLGVEVAYGDWMTGKLEPDFALGELTLKDAWVNWAFAPAFEVRFGQFKKPFSRIDLTSSTKILPIERGVRIRGLVEAFDAELGPDGEPLLGDFGGDLVLGEEYELLDVLGFVGHDIGVSIHGDLGSRLGYAVGAFNGSGADDRDDNDGKSVAGRLTFAPAAALPLSLGAGVSYRETTIEDDDDLDDDLDLAGTAFELDAEWGDFRRPGVHVIVEGAAGENLAVDQAFLAAQGWLAYFRALEGGKVEGLEPVVRLSWADPDTDRDDDAGLLLTPGFNIYFFGRNRFMVNWDWFFTGIEGFGAENALRVQGQVYF
ncbi:MAG TPA: porin [Longimicrobiales bacterium]